MRITVYTKPGCPPCKAIKHKFDELEIIYDEIDITQTPAAADKVKDYGFLAAPVTAVDLGDGAEWVWQGFAPSQIERLHIHLEGFDPEEVAA